MMENAAGGAEEPVAAALADWLARAIPGFRAPARLEKFEGGQSNPTYRLTDASGAAYVLRAKPGPAAALLPSAHAIEREFRVMDALRRARFPVPKVFALCVDEGIAGRAFYLMEHVEGRVFREPSLQGETPESRRKIYLEMARSLARLHAIDADSIGLGDYGRPANYLRRNFERWAKQYRATETERIPDMEWLLSWLPENIPSEERAAIVHGDFKIDNLVFHREETRIVAVLDWELSTLGHPLADLSYAAMAYHMAPPLFRGVAGLDLAALGMPGEEEFLAAYCEAAGLTQITDWSAHLALSFFRSAAIVQGIAKRALDGVAAHPRALEEGRLARPFAALGRRAAEGALATYRK